MLALILIWVAERILEYVGGLDSEKIFLNEISVKYKRSARFRRHILSAYRKVSLGQKTQYQPFILHCVYTMVGHRAFHSIFLYRIFRYAVLRITPP